MDSFDHRSVGEFVSPLSLARIVKGLHKRCNISEIEVPRKYLSSKELVESLPASIRLKSIKNNDIGERGGDALKKGAMAVEPALRPSRFWTDAEFGTALCMHVTYASTEFIIYAADESSAKNMMKTPKFTIPDCFHEQTAGIVQLAMANVILTNFSKFRPELQVLAIYESEFSSMSASGSSYIEDWESQVFSSMPNLQALEILGCNLTGSLPNSKHNLEYLDLSYNSLSGSIPDTLVSYLPNGTGYNFQLILNDNQLTGTLPEGLFANLDTSLDGSFAPERRIILKNNQLTGTLSSSHMTDIISFNSPDLELNVDNNRLTRLFLPLMSYINVATISGEGSQFTISAANNPMSLASTLPPAFIREIDSEMASFVINIPGAIGGVLPSPLARDVGDTSSFYLDISNGGWHIDVSELKILSTSLDPGAALSGLTLKFGHNEIYGQLPESIFDISGPNFDSFFSWLNIELGHNSIAGTISERFLELSSSPTALALDLIANPFPNILVDLSDNLLTGDFPASDVFSSPNISVVWFNLARNNISGHFPINLEPVNTQTDIFLDLSENSISGVLSSDIWSKDSGNLVSLDLNLDNNDISGPIPSPFASNVASGVRKISLRNNKITGGIPSNFMVDSTSCHIDLSGNPLGTPQNPAGFADLPAFCSTSWTATLVLDNTGLSGTIPPNAFSCGYSTFSANNNALTGTLPGGIFKASQKIFLSGNQLSSIGSLSGHSDPIDTDEIDLSLNEIVEVQDPSELDRLEKLIYFNFSSQRTNTKKRVPVTIPFPFGTWMTFPTFHVLDLSNNGYIGNLPNIEDFPSFDPIYSINLANNDLSGTYPQSWYTYQFHSLDLSNNAALEGNFTFAPHVLTLAGSTVYPRPPAGIKLSGTSLSGILPNMARKGRDTFSKNPTFNLDVHGLTQLDVCSPPTYDIRPNEESTYPYSRLSWVWNACNTELVCDTIGTNICDCAELYPRECTLQCFDTPSTPENNGPSPHQSPQNPANPPQNAPTARACSGSAPSAMFSCVNGAWVAYGSISASQLTITGSGPVKIIGNLSVNLISFKHLDASAKVTVSGCVQDLKSVSVEMNQEDMDKVEKERKKETENVLVVSENPSASPSCTNLALVPMSVKVVDKDKGCRGMKAKNSSSSSKGSLIGNFKVDMGKCNTWWIILLAVACAIIVIVIIVVLLVVFVKPIKRAVLPYEGS